MIKPDYPENEEERLKALYALQLLDTGPEERFDRLARIARKLFQVPIALVSLVDADRQWFKSVYGLTETEFERDLSFCGHTILNQTTMVIPDAARDSRFQDNPLVVDDHKLRFYAGSRIRTREGYVVGTLCIVDHQPRNFADDDIQLLEDLARMVESEIQATEQANMDELTGVYNRRGLESLVTQSLRFSRRNQQSSMLILFDIVKLNAINNEFGLHVGDTVLQRVGRELRRHCRDTDIIGRLGNDEFVALLHQADLNQAKRMVTRFMATMTAVKFQGADNQTIDLTFGIVRIQPESVNTLETLIREAESAMQHNIKQQQVVA